FMKVQALTLALTLTCFSLTACGRTEAPNASNAAMPAVQKAPSPPADIQSRIESAVVDYSSVKPALTLAGKVANGEDRYSKVSSRFELKSALAGTVVERTVTPGQSVGSDPSQVLFTVADLDKLQVVADVYERDLNLVQVAQVATVTVEAYPGLSFPAAVAAI